MDLTEVIPMEEFILHAKKLVLTHPVSKEIIIFNASTPNDNIWNSL
jgi:23S rRNA pseudouridine1911/1915/1917 synthase